MVVVSFIFIISLFLQNYQVATFCFLGFFYVFMFNLMSVNFSDNLEWMRNSVYSPKKLLQYYFLEQFLMLIIIGSIFLVVSGAVVFVVSQLPKEATSNILESDMATMLGPLYEQADHYRDSSATETALYFVFGFMVLFSFVFGGEILKTYFANLRYEKKFSKEARFFQIGMVLFVIYFMTMERIDSLSQFKIIFIPLALGLGSFMLIYATNQAYKIFRPSRYSLLSYVPVGIFAVLFSAAFGFAHFSFNMTKDINKKIAEHRFMGVLAPEFEKDFVQKAYVSQLTRSALSYMMENFPLDKGSQSFYQVVNSKGLEQKVLLTQMWKLSELAEDKKEYLMRSINDDFMKLESEKYKKKVSSLFLKINKKALNEKEIESYAVATYQKTSDEKREPASFNEKKIDQRLR